MVRTFTTAQSRRDFLKRTSALAAFGITTSLTPDLAFGQAKTDLSGVTIDYWNMIGVQNKIVRQVSEDIVNAFQKKTGATVNVTWNGYGDIIGPKYRTDFLGGVQPTVFDTASRWVNQLRKFLVPLNDYVDSALDPDTRAGIEWYFPLNEEENRGFPDKDRLYGLPFNIVMQAPYLIRRDHLEKAGIDFDANYPIRDTDHYIELCKEVQAKAGIPYPTEVYGKIWDFGDTQLNGWIRSLSIADSDFLNADWTKSNARSDAWKQGCQFYVDVFRKYKLSSPNTPQSTDEDAVDQFIVGRKSIVHCDILNRGTLLDRIPEQVADGTVMWGPHFPITGGTSGSQCFLGPNSFYIVKQTGADAEVKQQAAWEFIKEWFLPENMIAVAKSSGLCSRKDLWDQLKGEPDHSVEAEIATIGDNPGMWTGHPRSVDFQYNLLAPHGQKMLQGASVEDELIAYADEVDKVLKG
jgi:ABC-type glycerol-3-phosphate transport system substrate-binding protein